VRAAIFIRRKEHSLSRRSNAKTEERKDFNRSFPLISADE
jgi:hypothetical protein